ncbi:hypothetical protein LMG30113_06793 [Burkholderia paludis]|nr:hypothetical protein LMG30113_06793 [Burkholderia paludis]
MACARRLAQTIATAPANHNLCTPELTILDMSGVSRADDRGPCDGARSTQAARERTGIGPAAAPGHAPSQLSSFSSTFCVSATDGMVGLSDVRCARPLSHFQPATSSNATSGIDAIVHVPFG